MVNIYKVKFTLLQQEIMRFLFANAGKNFNARTIALALEVSQAAVSKALPKLEKENLVNVIKDKTTGRLSIELNRDNKKVIELKRVENLRVIYDSEIVEFLYHEFPEATIILFGSYSYGEDTITSDVDIAMIRVREKEINLNEFNKKLGKEIILHFYPNFKEINKNLKGNILNGILLKGGIEL